MFPDNIVHFDGTNQSYKAVGIASVEPRNSRVNTGTSMLAIPFDLIQSSNQEKEFNFEKCRSNRIRIKAHS